ncbi:hypothetical protein MYBA111488_24520 [Mycobacterium basiliense]
MTIESGALIAAIATPVGSKGSISSVVALIAIMAPPVGRVCINRPRAATSIAASLSDNTPAA